MEPRQQQFSLLYVLAEVLMMLAIQSYIGTSHGETLPMLQSGFAADFVLSMAVEHSTACATARRLRGRCGKRIRHSSRQSRCSAMYRPPVRSEPAIMHSG
jgi:hypothetical protein